MRSAGSTSREAPADARGAALRPGRPRVLPRRRSTAVGDRGAWAAERAGRHSARRTRGSGCIRVERARRLPLVEPGSARRGVAAPGARAVPARLEAVPARLWRDRDRIRDPVPPPARPLCRHGRRCRAAGEGEAVRGEAGRRRHQVGRDRAAHRGLAAGRLPGRAAGRSLPVRHLDGPLCRAPARRRPLCPDPLPQRGRLQRIPIRAEPSPVAHEGGRMTFDRYEEHDDTNEKHERRITKCRSCAARVIWFKTLAGKNMPVDADTVEADDDELDLSRHVSHFATCPQATQHRRR
ncbi:hypothetical protein DAPPUDRAFT_124771 [Daphnia pulex]|uniref:Uncharacterized protein n=1 Tax=Daphnia pulex TaxID=6669 RepID=E9I6W2_DAPPU|nr:hypothetical protein DAPPUDRAFT_124771 [Daphnia pulex]|eukprot:EFX60268.1 hypothetical protein DAPPUDRAFT_124771 [Daphnia pulex]